MAEEEQDNNSHKKMNRRTFVSGSLSGLFLLSRPETAFAEKQTDTADLFKTGYISDPVFLEHHIAPKHPETPDRVRFINTAVSENNLLEQLIPVKLKQNPGVWLKTVHTDQHIRSIKKHHPLADQVASAGVSACLQAVDQVVNKKLDNVFCAIRPPGHHALNTGREEGFCYYNNIAIAARYAQHEYGLKKVLIVDWDYHHGNATEALFYDDPDILFFSTHDQFAYPGTGSPARTGRGDGLGFNINVHLACGTKDDRILQVFKDVLVPAADRFKPDMVLISAGFDSREDDPLGCFNITDQGFIQLTRLVMQIANKYCDNRLVSILEGGYNLTGNAKAVVSHASALAGIVYP